MKKTATIGIAATVGIGRVAENSSTSQTKRNERAKQKRRLGEVVCVDFVGRGADPVDQARELRAHLLLSEWARLKRRQRLAEQNSSDLPIR